MIYFRPLLWPTLFATVAFAWLCGLGLWQLQRLDWKLQLVEMAQTRSTGAPVPFADVLARSSIDEMRYQKVSLSGTFDHPRALRVYAPHKLGPGTRIITPFNRSGGGTVLVDRGWIGEDIKGAQITSVAGKTSLTGLVIVGGKPTLGVGARRPGQGVWMFRDLDGMSDFLQLERPAPVFVIALPQGASPQSSASPNPWPLAEAPDLTFRNAHLSYAVTWFGLAFALVSVYMAFHVSLGRLAFAKPKENSHKCPHK